MLLFAFFCGCFPFRGQNDKELYKKIMKAELVIPEHVPPGPRAMLTRILQAEAELRPTAAELYCDSWVQGISQQTDQIFVNKNRSFSTNPQPHTGQSSGAQSNASMIVGINNQLNQTQQYVTGSKDPSSKEKTLIQN